MIVFTEFKNVFYSCQSIIHQSKQYGADFKYAIYANMLF